MSSSSTILDPSTTIASLATDSSPLLDVRLAKALQQRLGLQRPTLVQAQVWPVTVQQGRSCWIQAPTGAGKTLAYVVPAVQRILTAAAAASDIGDSAPALPRALFLVPTRELCHQVHGVVNQVLHYCDKNTLATAILSVGVARGTQQEAIQARQHAALRDEPTIVVGTPAAVALAMEKVPTATKLWNTMGTIVLDEADLLLRLGHEQALRTIVQRLPRLYQGMIVSATLPPNAADKNDAMQDLPNWALLETPVVIKIEQDDSATNNANRPPALKQLYLPVKTADKYLVLYVFLKLGLLQGRGLFFVATVNDGYRLKLFLQLFSIRAAVLNAELPVASRLHILQQFHAGAVDYVIATDEVNEKDKKNNEDNGDDDKDKDKRSSKRDADYGVARGIDFHRVSFVVNVDFPSSPTQYRHRIGRTARGGRSGVALSLVAIDAPTKKVTPSKKNKKRQSTPEPPSDWELLQAVQDDQPRIPLVQAAAQTHNIMNAAAGATRAQDDAAGGDAPTDQAQPVLLDFDLQEIEGFRYRVEDVSRAVTRKAVQEARTAELRAEMLNSERLQQHFAANPADAKLLQHDRPTSALHAPDHLKHVPKYLLPKGMQVAANLHKKKRKRRKQKQMEQEQHRASKDPLQSFQADVTLDGVAGQEEDEYEEDEAVAMNDDDDEEIPAAKRAKTESKVFASTQDGTGKSTAGRNAWKERHNKGKFKTSKQKNGRRKAALGI